MTVERWLAIEGYEGLYEVSDMGRVRSLDRLTIRKTGPVERTKGKVLKQAVAARMGYFYVNLSKQGRQNMRSVHRLVAKAFVPLDPTRPHVGHIDHNNKNNVASNLHWVTPQENTMESIGAGRWVNLHQGGRILAANNPARAKKLTAEDVASIRAACRRGEKQSDIGKQFGITQGVVSKIHRGDIWSTNVRSIQPVQSLELSPA